MVSEENRERDLLKNILNSLLPLYILEEKTTNNKEKLVLLKSYLSSDGLDIANIDTIAFSTLLSHILYFPKIMIDGYGIDGGTMSLMDLPWLSKDGYIFIENLYNKVFFRKFKEDGSKYNEISFRYTNGTNSLPESYDGREANFVVDACKELSEILLQTIEFSISSSEKSLLKFLRGAIECFISYTSEIYNFSYIKEYNTKSENIAIFDDAVFMKTTMDMDSFFFDERLSISLEDKGGQNEWNLWY